MRPPVPIKSGPVSGFGLFLTTAFTINALVYDIWEEVTLDTYSAFYYRKTVNPPLFMKILLLSLVCGGIFNYGRALIGLFTTDASTKRKQADSIGVGLFCLSLYFGIFYIGRMEKEIGLFHVNKNLDFTKEKFLQYQNDLFKAHLLHILLSILLLVQQYISFNNQKVDEKKEN